MRLSVVVAVLVCASLAAALDVTVQTSSGPIVGNQTPIGFNWKGIPYAAAPVGNLRWKNTEAPKPWTQPLKTQTFGPSCPQVCDLPVAVCPPTTSEDCLFMNIFSPNNATKLPVMVFIHGGHFDQGGAGMSLYDGSVLANTSNVVVVTMNYRLGLLGFLALGEFKGNYAMLDQRLALQYVQDNIANFGGDANRVTLFGQSAGAMSVGFHMVSEGSWDLFDQVIIESNPFTLPFLPFNEATVRGQVFAASANCTTDVAACLMALSIPEVLAAQAKAADHVLFEHLTTSLCPWAPVIDADMITDQPLTLMQQGKFKKTPVVIGDVGDEARMFVYSAIGEPMIFEECNAVIDVLFGKHAGLVRAKYPMPHNYSNDCRVDIDPMGSDYLFLCSSRNASVSMVQAGVPVYRYMFPHAVEEPNAWGPGYAFCNGYSCHAIELPFVFASDFAFNITFAQNELALSQTMMAYWGNFAWNSNPNGAGLVEWPLLTADATEQMYLNVPGAQVADDPRSAYCDFWDSVGYGF